jgi:hypothetical protein
MKKTKKTMTQCGQKNSQESIDINLDNLCVENINGISMTYANLNEKVYTNSTDNIKVYGDPMLVQPGSIAREARLKLSGQQVELLKTVVECLNEASEALVASDNHALSTTLKDLSYQINNGFGIE